jgi:NAD(P)-dependent dehydrogenase (short-subunit alcohol dehydrogenase family)
MRLQDKVAVITGGGQGIGRAYALRFIQEGAKIVVAEINESNGRKVVEEITAKGGDALYVKTDVSNEASTKEMAAKAAERFGRIDILINNAAIFYGLDTQDTSLARVALDDDKRRAEAIHGVSSTSSGANATEKAQARAATRASLGAHARSGPTPRYSDGYTPRMARRAALMPAANASRQSRARASRRVKSCAHCASKSSGRTKASRSAMPLPGNIALPADARKLPMNSPSRPAPKWRTVSSRKKRSAPCR